MMRFICLCVLILSITACGGRNTPAPVVELKWHPVSNHQSVHRVQRGETLFAIAFRYDKDFRQLAAWNHLRSPYALRVGQIIRIPPRARARYYTPVSKPRTNSRTRPSAHTAPVPRARFTPFYRSKGSWQWPARGRVVSGFVPQQGKKGMDIAGKKGDKVYASAAGVVAYAGNGLSGYGNLIIIKHNGQFLTAYGNNSVNRVKEGQAVKAGQIIADMGVMDRKFWGVHFEIRKAGQPVNPADYLPK